MAGTAQRYVELAQSLQSHTEVGLLAISGSTRPEWLHSDIKFLSRDVGLVRVYQFMTQYDTWFSQTLSKKEFIPFRRSRARFIYDGYDPVYVENLEHLKYGSDDAAAGRHLDFIQQELARVLKVADKVAYATPSQKHYLVGMSQQQKGFNLEKYRQDSSGLKTFVSVPFGLRKTPTLSPQRRQELRAALGVKPRDTLVLWGGGIWNWFDPLSLLKALDDPKLPKTVKLYFPGFRHPNADVPKTDMARKVQDFIAKHKYLSQRIIVGSEWVPYEHRREIFGIADVGASLHFESLETELSFRTRVLEYLAHELPIISTRGDFFAGEISAHQLGHVVDYEQPKEITAVLTALAQPGYRNEIADRVKQYALRFNWDDIAKNLMKEL
jgi:glycosyltransferase involved in cell wall biosynthesis